MNPSLLAELIDRHGGGLVLFARQWCPNPEDVVQEAFCKLVSQRTLPADPVAWLFRVTKNRALDVRKANRRRAKRESVVAKPIRWFAESEINGLDAVAAVAALETLPPEQREVIVARLWGDMTLEQAANALGCSVSTTHRRYEHGILALRQALRVPTRTG